MGRFSLSYREDYSGVGATDPQRSFDERAGGLPPRIQVDDLAKKANGPASFGRPYGDSHSGGRSASPRQWAHTQEVLQDWPRR